MKKTVLLLALAAALLLTACGEPSGKPAAELTSAPAVVEDSVILLAPEATPVLTPVPTPTPAPALKYVFLLIGDGMGDAQISVTEQVCTLLGREELLFPTFPVHATVTTHNIEDRTTDSAAAATALSSGHKTENGRLGTTPDGESTVSVAEELHAAGYRVGMITTVTCDHATPGGFYAHRSSRTDYAGITEDLFASGFEFFAGCGLSSKQKEAKNGYTLFSGAPEDAPEADRLVLLTESALSDASTRYAMDGGAREDLLARMLTCAIPRLDNGKGFFIMAEGGNIDTACHNHDYPAMIYEVLDFDSAVRTAYAFYEQHPEETLIVVTADHETGALSQEAGDLTLKQTVSCKAFDQTDVLGWKKSAAAFEEALPVIETVFGLDKLSKSETAYLEEAYAHTLTGDLSSEQRIEKYHSNAYSPIAMAAENLVLARAGIKFASRGHSNTPVSVYAVGFGADAFASVTDNTDIPRVLRELTGRN